MKTTLCGALATTICRKHLDGENFRGVVVDSHMLTAERPPRQLLVSPQCRSGLKGYSRRAPGEQIIRRNFQERENLPVKIANRLVHVSWPILRRIHASYSSSPRSGAHNLSKRSNKILFIPSTNPLTHGEYSGTAVITYLYNGELALPVWIGAERWAGFLQKLRTYLCSCIRHLRRKGSIIQLSCNSEKHNGKYSADFTTST